MNKAKTNEGPRFFEEPIVQAEHKQPINAFYDQNTAF